MENEIKNLIDIDKYFPDISENRSVIEKRKIQNIEQLYETEISLANKGVFFLILEAIKCKASDIHIEPMVEKIRIRFRINGLLKNVAIVDKFFLNIFISKIKILSTLDIVEKRHPQDGRFSLRYKEREIDFRTAIIPTIDGEKIVIRILDKFSYDFSLEDLYLSEFNKIFFMKGIRKNNGIILINGPTGSGKSTTLYSILKYKNSPEVNISTVEDPIEYQIEGINQIQCRNELGLDFSNILRALLRQDPDIIMIGEIRDKQTAEIAVRASLTGHLVLSTLHSNDTLGCINRLINLGIDPYLLNLVLIMILSQRLVRKLCPDCKKEDLNFLKKLKILGRDNKENIEAKYYISCGCEKCFYTGYIGRIPIFEILYLDDEMKNILDSKENMDKIYEKAIRNGMKKLIEDGILKAQLGLTSLDEIMRQL